MVPATAPGVSVHDDWDAFYDATDDELVGMTAEALRNLGAPADAGDTTPDTADQQIATIKRHYQHRTKTLTARAEQAERERDMLTESLTATTQSLNSAVDEAREARADRDGWRQTAQHAERERDAIAERVRRLADLEDTARVWRWSGDTADGHRRAAAALMAAVDALDAASASVPPTPAQVASSADLVDLLAETEGARRNGLASDGRGWFRLGTDREECYAVARAAVEALTAAGRQATPTGPASQVAPNLGATSSNLGAAPTGPVADTTTPLGYIVLIREHVRWTDNWDAAVHPTLEEGQRAVAAARAAGYEAVLIAAVPVSAEPTPAPARPCPACEGDPIESWDIGPCQHCGGTGVDPTTLALADAEQIAAWGRDGVR
jgi:hypothetical protein